MSKAEFAFDDQTKQVVSFFLLWNFLREIEIMFLVFLLSYYRMGELKKAVELLACQLIFPKRFSCSQTSTHVSIT